MLSDYKSNITMQPLGVYYLKTCAIHICPLHYYIEITITGVGLVFAETLYHREDALLYIAYEMLIWAAPIPATG